MHTLYLDLLIIKLFSDNFILNKLQRNHLKCVNNSELILYFFVFFFADASVRAALVHVIPDIFARCIEIGNPELEYFLFDRMLEIVLRFLKNEENMVSILNKVYKFNFGKCIESAHCSFDRPIMVLFFLFNFRFNE